MLPIFTTAEDVQQIVEYFKTKPTGATLVEARAVLGKRLLDGRKIAAYLAWGVLTREGDRMKLSPRGWEFARASEGGVTAFRSILDSIVPYRSALEWMHHQGFEDVSTVDAASHWHEHHSEALGTSNENTIKDNAVAFFHLCQAAGLGKLTMGRGGKPTRLTVSRSALQEHIEAGPSAPPWVEAPAEEAVPDEPGEDEPTPPAEEQPQDGEQAPPPAVLPERLRVFISHGEDMTIVEQVETMLGLAEMEVEVAVKEETTAIPVPEKVLNAMRRCHAGIIAVTADEGRKDADGNYVLNDNVLIEIGAAFVLYDRRVVLVWDKRLPVPSNLQGLYRCEFEGDELSWSAGMKLMKAIREFRDRPS